MSDRFFIDCNGIIDNWKRTNGDCSDRLTWSEICDTLNELDDIAENTLDEYKLIVELQDENQRLKLKLTAVQGLLQRIKDYQEDMELILND